MYINKEIQNFHPKCVFYLKLKKKSHPFSRVVFIYNNGTLYQKLKERVEEPLELLL